VPIADWRKVIGILIFVHDQIRDLDSETLWGNELPRVAATESALAVAEFQLGSRLHASYRAFLLHADGWRGFYQWVDLFGTPELAGEPMLRALRQLERLEREGLHAQRGLRSSDLLPVAMTREGKEAQDPDLFVIVREGRPQEGRIFWYGRDEIDTFDTFDSFFLAMLDYNREEFKDLVREAKEKGRVM